MIFHENRLLADDSRIITYLIFSPKLGKMLQNLSSAAVVIGALRVKNIYGPNNDLMLSLLEGTFVVCNQFGPRSLQTE